MATIIKASPVKCDVMKRKDEPKRVKERPTAPLVLIRVPGLVAKLAVHTAITTQKYKQNFLLSETDLSLHKNGIFQNFSHT